MWGAYNWDNWKLLDCLACVPGKTYVSGYATIYTFLNIWALPILPILFGTLLIYASLKMLNN